jgi:hypothetical protein
VKGGNRYENTLEWKTGRQTQHAQVGTCVPTLRLPNLSVGIRKPNKGGERHKKKTSVEAYIIPISKHEY